MSFRYVSYSLKQVCEVSARKFEILSTGLKTCLCVFVVFMYACVLVCGQEVEYVKEEAKMVYLLECLQKTPPPVSTPNTR